MGHRQNTIELNGKRYDAHSGVLVATHPTTTASSSHRSITAQRQQGTVIDGFMRRPHHLKPNQKSEKRTTHQAHLIHTKPERSKTLMRHVVPKPAESKKLTKTTSSHHETARIARAHHVPKSRLISKFGSGQSSVTKKLEPLSVREAPVEIAPADDPPILPTHTLTISPFEEALKRATSHTEPRLKKTRLHHRAAKKLHVSPRTLNLGATIAVTLIVGGVIAYRSVPSLAINLAARRAGIQASLPGYQPAGFALTGPVQYSPGQITLNYKSNADSRSFSVIQKKSDWTSQNLLDKQVAVNNRSYQTLQDKGKTIYIYNDNNAVWVSKGTLYKIEGPSSLNSDQLLKIASSL